MQARGNLSYMMVISDTVREMKGNSRAIDAHVLAWNIPKPGIELALRTMVTSLGEYAAGHYEAHHTKLGSDKHFGEAWALMANGFLQTISRGHVGRFDAATLEKTVRDLAAWCDVELD